MRLYLDAVGWVVWGLGLLLALSLSVIGFTSDGDSKRVFGFATLSTWFGLGLTLLEPFSPLHLLWLVPLSFWIGLCSEISKQIADANGQGLTFDKWLPIRIFLLGPVDFLAMGWSRFVKAMSSPVFPKQKRVEATGSEIDKAFPYRDMTLLEAELIWSNVINSSQRPGPDAFMRCESELPPGGVIALAEAFAIVYLNRPQTAELYEHLCMGLTLFGGYRSDFLNDLPPPMGSAARVSGIPVDRLLAFGMLSEDIAEISRNAAHKWFQKRIGDAPRFD